MQMVDNVGQAGLIQMVDSLLVYFLQDMGIMHECAIYEYKDSKVLTKVKLAYHAKVMYIELSNHKYLYVCHLLRGNMM